jgi:hypothetical protein
MLLMWALTVRREIWRAAAPWGTNMPSDMSKNGQLTDGERVVDRRSEPGPLVPSDELVQ